VGVASGGVWKTVNDGTTWTPVFDGEGSYSIGWIELDPNNARGRLGRNGREATASAAFPTAMACTAPMMAGKKLEEPGAEEVRAHRRIVIDPRDSQSRLRRRRRSALGPGGDRGLY